ncbi:MAG: carbon-nitrogen hydrolase family protein [Lachnospiraceae bacterium]|nr:carbon-nitrogen hydrolase family protein [Lachnospiraceae bacterium]
MKLAMAQMSMSEDMEYNFKKTILFMEKAREADLIFFPEVQLSPFFPQYENKNADKYVVYPEDDKIKEICEKCKEFKLFASPNFYMQLGKERFDSSLWIDPLGKLLDIAKMVHILQAKQFYEKDYYTPSDDGFKVFDTPFGKVGIVVCYDRHLPESIRTCAVMGAQLIIIPTANTKGEPLEMFEWELRVQAMQSNVFIAMCNRVGLEDEMDFCGGSIVVDPEGEIVFKADGKEQLITVDIDLSFTGEARKKRPYITTRRPEFYK